MKLGTLLLACALALLPCSPALSAYPERPVNIYVGFAAGGAGDIVARAVGHALEKELGQPVVIVNKGGRGGALAIGEAMTTQPDGYTIIGTISSALTIDPLTTKLKHTINDFKMIGLTGLYQEGFFCMADKPWKNMREMVEWAKKENKPLSYTSSVVFVKLITEFIGKKEGVTFRPVPVEGGAQVVSSVLGGHADFGFGGGIQAPYVKAGKVRNLSSSISERFKYFPDVPTLGELGWPEVSFDNYFAFYALKNVPDEIVAKLIQAVEKAGNDPEVQRILSENAGLDPVIITGAKADAILRESLDAHAKLLKQIGK